MKRRHDDCHNSPGAERRPGGRHRADHRTSHRRMRVRGNPWWTLAAVSIGVIMVGLDASVVAIANPHIAADLHASLSDLQWITDAYMLALAALLIFGGKLGDRFGRRKVFFIGVVGFALASVGIGLAGTVAGVIALRTAAGRVRCAADARAPWPSSAAPSRPRSSTPPSASGARPPVCRSRPARSSVACSSSTSTGSRCSTSTRRSPSRRCSSARWRSWKAAVGKATAWTSPASRPCPAACSSSCSA